MKSKLVVFGLVFAYATTLVCSYVFFVQPPFDYMGLQISPQISVIELCCALGLASVLSLFLPKNIDRPSSLFCGLIYLLVYVPTVAISRVSLTTPDRYWLIPWTFTASMAIIILISRIKTVSISFPKLSVRSYKAVFVSAILLSSGLVFMFYRPDFSSLMSLEDIASLYDIRSEYRESNTTVPTVVQYLFSWLAKFFSPALLVFGLLTRRKGYVIVSFIVTLTLFVISGHKSIFLGLFAILGFWFFVKDDGRLTFRKFAFVGLFAVLVATIGSIFGFSFLTEIIIRRTMIIPGVLSGFYIEFFSENTYAKLGYSFFSSFSDYPYWSSPPFVIGNEYFGRSEMSANANFIAAGFAEFGPIGSIVFSAAAALTYKLLDSLAMQKDLYVPAMMLALIPTWALVDSAFQTTLLTHGLIILILFLAVLPSVQMAKPKI